MPAGAAGWGETSQDLGIHFNAISLGGLLVCLLLFFFFRIDVTTNNQTLLPTLVPRPQAHTHTHTHTQAHKESVNQLKVFPSFLI